MLQLDYNSGPPGTPTLRQMIMGLTVGDEDTPLFHSVDLDWKGVGYVFQFSPEVRAHAECTVHTLLPLLQYHYPDSAIENNFTQRTVEKCRHMAYDEATGTVIDPSIEESLQFVEEELLPGFSLDMSMLNSKEEDRSVCTGFPSASDSVSTLGNPAPRVAPTVQASRFQPVRIASTSHRNDSSVVSSTSAITIETLQTMETQIQSLQQQVRNTDNKFNELMDFLRQGNGNTSQRADPQLGTASDPVTLDAGGDNQSSSGKVP